jgi:hypothetical protein
MVVKHTIRLLGPAARGPRVSMHLLRDLSETVLEAAQRSLRLRVEGRSNLQGKTAWLDAATDIQLVGLREGSTVLELEAPPLGEAAPEIFEQLPVFDLSPGRDQSAFSLVEEAARDAIAGNADSDLLDRNILDCLSSFHRVLDQGFDSIVLNGGTEIGQKVDISPDGLKATDRLRREAPPAQPVIVSGWLDQLTGSKRAFTLLLPSGQSLRGLLPPDDPSAYAPLFTKKVVVDGEARFRPSGAVSLIIASNIQPATAADAVWEQLPRPRPRSLAELKPRTPPPPGSNGMERVFGHWPGDETTEELLAALKAID